MPILREKKIELDRRLLHDRISLLKEQLKELKRHRQETRKTREAAGKFVVAIVGYTNAGKSTLLNALTGADALAGLAVFVINVCIVF